MRADEIAMATTAIFAAHASAMQAVVAREGWRQDDMSNVARMAFVGRVRANGFFADSDGFDPPNLLAELEAAHQSAGQQSKGELRPLIDAIVRRFIDERPEPDDYNSDLFFAAVARLGLLPRQLPSGHSHG